jgi:hypothetical protein
MAEPGAPIDLAPDCARRDPAKRRKPRCQSPRSAQGCRIVTEVSKRILSVEDNQKADGSVRSGSEPPYDAAWPVVEAIGPEEDVLSKLSVEDEGGKPVASNRARRTGVPDRPPRRGRGLMLVAVGAVGVVAAGGWYWFGPARRSEPVTGAFSIETSPTGAIVSIDGKVQGASPLAIPLAPGQHVVEVAGITKRTLTVTIEPGARLAQYVELPEAPAVARVHIESTPPGAQVSIDGVLRGAAPLEVADLAPGGHVVTLKAGTTIVTQNINVEDGRPIALVVPITAPEATQPGLIAVASPVELQIYEGDQLVGTSGSDRIEMPAGRHDLRLVNGKLAFATTRAVQVAPGRTSTVQVQLPNGALFVNAIPWAEVFVDGSKIGDTPIADYKLPVGTHDIALRNPRFAEQRRTVVITLAAPVRLGVDLRQ